MASDSTSIRLALRIAAAVAVAVWALVFFGEERRVEHDPRFCASSCHHEATHGASADFHAGGHEGVACQECHRTSLATGLRLLVATYTKPATPVAHGAVTAADCAGCHEKRPAEWRLVAETAGHREHRDVKKVDCLSCHASSTHAKQAPEEVCLGCHEDQRLHRATTAGAETCLSCHGFAASEKNRQPPTTVACVACHDSTSRLAASAGGAPLPAMKDVNAHVLHGDVACQLCHNAHGKRPKPAPEGQPSCAACHSLENTQVATQPQTGPGGHRDCEGCHKQHLPVESALQRCADCHPKNAEGLLGDGTVVRTTALQHPSCASCHRPHTWKAEPSGCMQCHKAETELFQTRSPPEHKACTDCHDVHGSPPSGAVCLKCHSDTKSSHVALAPERHKDCTSCHDPHAPKPEDTRASCARCHSNEATQLVRDGPEAHAKDSCFTCHKPHDNPMPPPGICGSCHADKARLVEAAEPPKHQVCISCHQPHEFRIADVTSTCSKCHGPLFDTSDKPFTHVAHQGDCKGCHTFHGPPGVPQPKCLGCHQDVAGQFKPRNEKHAECRSCHEPHTPASTAPARCATCHAEKAAVAAMWPPASAHAQACNGCHQPHAAQAVKACSECHAAEATSAMGGKHECKQCHAPHAAPPGTGPAWWSRCSTCHAAKVESAKAEGPTHAECKNCHQPHRFAVPSCTGCHNDMGTKGLHGSARHAANCTSCHDPHVKSLPTREQCLACHTDKRAHEPNAKECFTCHLFR